MRLASPAVMALALLVAPACSHKPSSWKDWIDEAPAALKAGQFDKLFDACRKAFDYAHEEKSGPKAVAALECTAFAAASEGRMEKSFPQFEIVLGNYDADLRVSGAGLRLRNNYGVALVEAGRKQEGVDLLDASLDAYDGTPQQSRDNYRIRMQLVANLARAVRVFPDSDASVRVSTEILQEIRIHIENDRYHNNLPDLLGTADAMTAIAELIRLRGDPAEAERVLAEAREELAIEDDVLAGQMRRPPCEPVTVRSLLLRPCYATLR